MHVSNFALPLKPSTYIVQASFVERTLQKDGHDPTHPAKTWLVAVAALAFSYRYTYLLYKILAECRAVTVRCRGQRMYFEQM